MTDPGLREVDNIHQIKGISYPAGVRFRQLIVTGQPGAGKTTRVRAIGGWPDEGYLDLTERRWWHSRVLAVRPREVHLGLPFRGHGKGLALFEKDWLEDSTLDLEIDRVTIPPERRRLSFIDWRKRYVFEFLLPPAEKILSARLERSYRHSHPVDADLSPGQVTAQLAIFRAVAWHFHQAGVAVVVRDDFDGPPKVFATGPSDRGTLPDIREHKPSRLQGLLDRLTRTQEIEVPESLDRLHLAGERARIETRLLPLELTLGPQIIRIERDRSLTGLEVSSGHSVLLFDPEEYAERVSGFVRLGPGERVRIGKREEEWAISLKLPEKILPRLEVSHEGDRLALTDLHSPTGTDIAALRDPEETARLVRDRRRALARVHEIFGGPIRPLSPDQALSVVREVNSLLETSLFRPRDTEGRPGGVVEMAPGQTPIIVGDLHARIDNLLTILSSNRFLEWVERGRATLLFLGDAVHPEEEELLAEMDSSLLMMDVIFKLLAAFPQNVVYLRGNHDSFSHEVTKEGVPQGHLWREHAEAVRGATYRAEMERFYDLLPHIATSPDLIACHAGPPREAVSRDRLVNIRDHPRLMHQLTWNRLKSPSKPAGYTRADVRALRSALGVPASTALIVSHNPPRDGESAWRDLGGIEDHHLVYSALDDRVSVFTRIGDRLVPLTFRTQPLAP